MERIVKRCVCLLQRQLRRHWMITLLATSGVSLVACTAEPGGTAVHPVARQALAAPTTSGGASKVPDIIRQASAKVRSHMATNAATPASLGSLSNALVHVDGNGAIEVTIHAASPITQSQESALSALGARITSRLAPPAAANIPTAGMVQAWVPNDQLDAIAALPWVVQLTPPDYSPPDSVVSEGVALLHADRAIAQGITGSGVKVGVISNGANSLAQSQASGDLPGSCPGPTPCVTVLDSGGGDEGTAMMEIVHDMAPGADLFFHGTGGGVTGHVNALNALVAAGVNVITEDIPFDTEPAFQQGLAAATGEAIASMGISMHSSAGNLGSAHTARVLAVGTNHGPDGVTFATTPPNCGKTPHNVVAIASGGDTTFDWNFGAGSCMGLNLQWSEPRSIFPTAGQGGFTDLNLYVMDSGLTACLPGGSSTTVQTNGTGDTIEQVWVCGSGVVKIIVDVESTSSAVAPPMIDLRWRGGGSPVNAADVSRFGSLNPDSNYSGLAESEGAAYAITGSLEDFSAGGPVLLGLTTVCPGGLPGPCTGVAGPALTSTVGPTWTGADGVSVNGSGGFGSPFFGTSAATPHGAGCDALVRQALGASASVGLVRSRLASTATDMSTPGPDNNTGAGMLNCFAGVGGPTARCKDVTIPADGTCHASVTPSQIDNGSSDPFGLPLTFTVIGAGPFGLGTFPVVLSVSNGRFSDTCNANVTVQDTSAPTITVPTTTSAHVCQPADSVTIGQATAHDNCTNPVPTGSIISMNGNPLPTPIPVVSGTATLAPGTYVIQWTVSDGSNTTTVNQTLVVSGGIETSDSFLLDDRAKVLGASGSYAEIFNAGSGQTRLGVEAKSGGIESVGPVSLADRALVSGAIVSGGTVTVSPWATVTGAITAHAPLLLPPLPSLPAFPPATGQAIYVNSGETKTLAPGSYRSTYVNSGGTLVLSAGDYYFTDTLAINSASTVRVASSTRIFVSSQLAYRSPFRLANGSVASIYLGLGGTSNTVMEAVFNGTILSPSGAVTFGVGSGLEFHGSFMARTIEVRPDSHLICM